MALERFTKVVYSGTNIGIIYLEDVGRRPGLGGGSSIYVDGQDKYIKYGETKRLLNTSEVQLSVDAGVLAHYAANAGETRFSGSAPLVLTQTSTDFAEVLV